MSRSWSLILLLLLLPACQRGSAVADTASHGADSTHSEPTGEGTRPYLVGAEVLDRYIRFQEHALEVQAKALQDLARMERQGTADGPEAAELVRQQAEAQARAQKEAQLSDQDVQELERIVGDVISRRALASTAEEEASLAELETLAARLSDADRAPLDKSISEVRSNQKSLEALAEERKRFGDANVDAVLSREKELKRLWNKMIRP